MKIGSLKHRVVLCSAYDEAVTETKVLLMRQRVVESWAGIIPVHGTFLLNGYAVREARESPSHYIRLRWGPDLDISGYAWVFEQRWRSGARWFKILDVTEDDEAARFWRLDARLVERGGEADRPQVRAPGDGIFAPRPLTGVRP